MLITGENPDAVQLGSCLSDDGFQGQRFDYMITNPPFGVSWKSEEQLVKTEAQTANSRFSVGTPRTSDGSLLFLQHMLFKMESRGSRVGIVLNGSPMFTGDAGSGESNIRKWIIENDWLECIVALPEYIFFNTGIPTFLTGIPTFLWILTNRKSDKRKGKIQLINAVDDWEPMSRGLGEKRRQIGEKHVRQLTELYTNFQDTEHSKIFPNRFFGFTKVTIERPLIDEDTGCVDRDRKGNPKPNPALREDERIPLAEDIDDYFRREIKPHLPDSWMDRKKDKVGYEMNFNQHFYSVQSLPSLKEITNKITKLDKESETLMHEILEI